MLCGLCSLPKATLKRVLFDLLFFLPIAVFNVNLRKQGLKSLPSAAPEALDSGRLSPVNQLCIPDRTN